ncbi:hypothetical protein GWC95_11190 [Sediminibacterium roseum]|uniref:DUF4384 domain-containing protein n=1 Tax=Sediminibacterium roseum TaxID=1978412 RepID=A0ABW9ZVH6_9BACT|nr:hypothetical protein [Sediminibacterium roseum]NCI50490.1 hypothetical protein [Sediminibacterium roseum]
MKPSLLSFLLIFSTSVMGQVPIQNSKIYSVSLPGNGNGYMIFKTGRFLFLKSSSRDLTPVKGEQFSSISEGTFQVMEDMLTLVFSKNGFRSYSTDTFNYKSYGTSNWDSIYIELRVKEGGGLVIIHPDGEKRYNNKNFIIGQTGILQISLPSSYKIKSIEVAKTPYAPRYLPYNKEANKHEYMITVSDPYETITDQDQKTVELKFKETKGPNLLFSGGAIFTEKREVQKQQLLNESFPRLFLHSKLIEKKILDFLK